MYSDCQEKARDYTGQSFGDCKTIVSTITDERDKPNVIMFNWNTGECFLRKCVHGEWMIRPQTDHPEGKFDDVTVYITHEPPPTQVPTEVPTMYPTVIPTILPSVSPSKMPSVCPSVAPSTVTPNFRNASISCTFCCFLTIPNFFFQFNYV